MIHDLYDSFFADRFWVHREEMLKFLSRLLVERIIKADKADLLLSSCPIVPGSDYDEKEVKKSLVIKSIATDSGTACLVTLSNFGTKYSITYQFKKEAGKWRISDIVTDGTSFLQSLPR